MKLYFAGGENESHKIKLDTCKVEKVLQSYYYLRGRSPQKYKDVLLDSGGFTARIKGVEIDVKEYAGFINKNNVKLAINLDTNNVEETLENQEYLNKNTEAYILPVYHLSDFLSKEHKGLLDVFAAEYPFICVGGMAGGRSKRTDVVRFLNYVYSKIRLKCKIHGLGITGFEMLKQFPFYSVDSTSWLQGEKFGNVLQFNPRRKGGFEKAFFKDKKDMSKIGKPIDSYKERTIHNIKELLKLENYITKLWETRNIKWDTEIYQ